jgi:glycosyltransferase involved in cell wall biosynthesis
MIVKNEESFLGEALAAAKPHCDEMIVVDTGSNDATVAIAESHGARVFHFGWTGDFAAARNFSIGKANGDWILVLDADERIVGCDWEKLKEKLDEERLGNGAPDSFDLPQINYAFEPALVGFKTNDAPVPGFETYPGFTESRLTRLFRNRRGLRFEGVVHEHVCRDGRVVDGEFLPVRIHHRGQALSPEKMRAKKEFYRELGREKARLHPDDFKARHELGIAHWESGDLAAAETEFSAARCLKPRDAKNLVALGTVLQLRGDPSGAETVFSESIRLFPRDPSPYAALGCCLRKLGRLDEAIAAFKRWVEIDPDSPAARSWLSDVYAERRFKDPDARPSLTVCYIVKDEADCLARSLDNVLPHCDEIVVVDTGSSDGTVGIARSRGAKTFPAGWHDDFSRARNESLKHATSEWILVLDADEVLSAEDWLALGNLILRAAVSMHFLVQTTYSDAPTVLNWKPNDIRAPEAFGYKGYFESPLVRLFRNTPRIRFHGAVHEHARHDDASVRAAPTGIRIHHYGKFRTPGRMREKYELYHRIGVEKAASCPGEAQPHYELAVQRMELGIDEGVEAGFREALRIDPSYADALMGYANYLLGRKRMAESLDCFMRLISVKPRDPQVYVYTASLLIEIGKYELALRMLETAKDLGGGDSVALLMNEGVIHLRLENNALAEACFRKAFAVNPDFAPMLVNLGIALERGGNSGEAEGHFRRAADIAPRDATARQKLGELLFAAERREESLAAFLEAHELSSADPDILSQIVVNAHALERNALVLDFEARLAAMASTSAGRAALGRIAALYECRSDETAARRLATLLDNAGAF